MKRRLFLIFLVVGLSPFMRGNAQNQKIPICKQGITSIGDCPSTGCNHNQSNRRGGDPVLNQAKNRTDVPSGSVPEVLYEHFAMELKPTEPSSWRTGKERSSLEGEGREGSPVVFEGWLKNVGPGGSETCNCQLTNPQDVDVHLAITRLKNDLEKKSITAEFTPFMRANGHPAFTYFRALALKGKYIRVTGWIMLDTEHVSRPLNRLTNWEIHPVTKFEWCTTTKAACDAGTGWRELK